MPPAPPDPPPAPADGAGRPGNGKGTTGAQPRSRSRVLDVRKRDPATGKVPPWHGSTELAEVKTPALLMRQPMASLVHWFPDRRFVLLGDQAFGTHDLALFCRRRRHVSLVSRARPVAALYARPVLPEPTAKPKATAPRKAAATGGQAAGGTATRSATGNSSRPAAAGTGLRGGGRAALVPVRRLLWEQVPLPHAPAATL